MAAVATDVFFSSSSILSSTSGRSRRSVSQKHATNKSKTQNRTSQSRNQVFNDPMVESFLVSSSNNLNPSSVIITRQDIPKLVSSPKKRYVSSFKTLVNSTNDKHTQRLNYVNDSVMIFKLSKEKNHQTDLSTSSQFGTKYSSSSAVGNVTSMPSKSETHSSSTGQLSPLMKIEGQRRRTAHQHDSPITTTTTTTPAELTAPTTISLSTTSMTMSTTSHHPTQTPAFTTYRTTVNSSNTNRQRTITDATSNGLLFTTTTGTERVKSNISLSMRANRPMLTATSTSLSSAYLSSQQTQRYAQYNSKSRSQQDRSTTNRDLYDYPDPFTNCPQDLLSKLSQLTKLQLETIEWEKKRRFTKKKPLVNNSVQGKDSP